MSELDMTGLWSHLSSSSLLWLTITILVYLAAQKLYRLAGATPLLNPVAVTVVSMITILKLTNTDYQTFFSGAGFIHFLLGPATVALAVPRYKNLSKLNQVLIPAAVALVTGVFLAASSAVAIAWMLGASGETLLSLAPKSVTAPVAMGIAEKIGGLPSLTAALVIITGIIGAMLGTTIFRLLGIEDDSVKGISMGVTSHGIGTARAFLVSNEMGAFSGLAMGLSAMITALILPWVVSIFN